MTPSFTAEAGRLDAAVAHALGISRGDAQRAIGEGRVRVNGTVRAKSFRLMGGEQVEASLREPGDLPAEEGRSPSGSRTSTCWCCRSPPIWRCTRRRRGGTGRS